MRIFDLAKHSTALFALVMLFVIVTSGCYVPPTGPQEVVPLPEEPRYHSAIITPCSSNTKLCAGKICGTFTDVKCGTVNCGTCDGTCSADGTTCTPATTIYYAACNVRDSATNLPNPKDPNLGKGYAKKNIGKVDDYHAARRLCTDAVFNSLMETYCASNHNPVRWGVAVYPAETGGVGTTSGCAASGCEYHSCPTTACTPDAEACSGKVCGTFANGTCGNVSCGTCAGTCSSDGTTCTPDTRLFATCNVRDSYTNLPNPADPDAGKGYAKTNLGRMVDYNAAKANCTDDVFKSLMETYCASNNNTVQWGVAVCPAETGGVGTTSGCAASGCDYHSCPTTTCTPDAEACSGKVCGTFANGTCGTVSCGSCAGTCSQDGTACTPLTGVFATCNVRDSYTNLPVPADPDAGMGYAKMNLAGISDLNAAKAQCTDDMFNALMAKYCALNTFPVQWGVATYSSATQWGMSTCAASGCDFHSCPTPPPVVLDEFNGATQGQGFGSLTYENGPNGRVKAVNLAQGTYIKYSFPNWYTWDGVQGNWNRPEATPGQLTQGKVDMWIKPRKYTELLTFNWNDVPSPPPAGYIMTLGLTPEGKLTYSVWGGYLGTALVGKTTVPLNTWSHIAVSWGPTGTALYLNGNVDASTSGNLWPAFWGRVYAYLNDWGQSDLGLVDDFRISNATSPMTP